MFWIDGQAVVRSPPVGQMDLHVLIIIMDSSCDEDVDGVDDARDVSQDGEQQADPELHLNPWPPLLLNRVSIRRRGRRELRLSTD
jgi:hypothetical protein